MPIPMMQVAAPPTAAGMTVAQIWPLLTASQRTTLRARLRKMKVDVSDLPS